MLSLRGKVAIVTGASRGIGAAIANQLAHDGAAVVVNYSRSAERAERLAAELREQDLKAVAVKADVACFEQAQELVRQAVEEFGTPHLLVNNAGITRDRTLIKMGRQEWEEVVDTNLGSVFNCCRAVVPHMIPAGGGHIVNISSVNGKVASYGQTNYSATKAGIIGFSRSLAVELARHNITVNSICPGFTETEMLAQVPEDVRQSILKRIPLGRFCRPDEVARAVRFLAVDGGYITGATIDINGGLYM